DRRVDVVGEVAGRDGAGGEAPVARLDQVDVAAEVAGRDADAAVRGHGEPRESGPAVLEHARRVRCGPCAELPAEGTSEEGARGGQVRGAERLDFVVQAGPRRL